MPAPSDHPLPADARLPLFFYNLLFPFVFLLLLPSFLLRMIRRGNYREKFGQRLGFYSTEDRNRLAGQRWIWIHSISVGETFVALKLARQLHAANPACRILLSVTTSTGFALARESAADWLEPIYNPIDLRSIVRRTLDVLQPESVVLIEGDVWPNFLAETHRRGIPVWLANARLSPRSERRFRRFRSFAGPLFRLLKGIAAPDSEDVERWASIGLLREKIHVTGNIKFDYAVPGESRADEFRALVAPLGITAETPILLAGSTFDGEEKLLAEILLELRRTFPDLVLILVPRHVERTATILRELASLGLRITRRTTLPLPTPSGPDPCDILLVDTTGELRDWYALATVVFIGKSLTATATGGQNPAEAVILGKPVLFGPHMENFEILVAHLLRQQAALQVPDVPALKTQIATLLSDPTQRAAMGARGRDSLIAHQSATARVTSLLNTPHDAEIHATSAK